MSSPPRHDGAKSEHAGWVRSPEWWSRGDLVKLALDGADSKDCNSAAKS